jgi:superfamily II DNA or RNA helicase
VTESDAVWWRAGRRAVHVVSRSELWGRRVVEAIDSASATVLRLNEEDVVPLSSHEWLRDEVVWRAAACRALAAASDGAAVATVASGVELLPHQSGVVSRALALDPVRLALCDEVGLGKTITAAAIYVELKKRGRALRVLVVAPKSVQLQWVGELAGRFGEEFVRVGPEGMPVDSGVDPWRAFTQVVCSFDAVKPIRVRAGLSADQVEAYNRSRVKAIVAAGWDLVIFDEAHHVAGSSDVVARHLLARELAAAVPNVLLLSATPHSGKSDGFRRFLGLLDPTFFAGAPLNRDRVRALVARTEKRSATDVAGRPLFTPRITKMEVVRYGDRTVERDLYEGVTEYVREGYGRALREKRPAIGFLLLLMQRLVSSSTESILSALERRATALDALPEQRELPAPGADWDELSGDEQLARIADIGGCGWASERSDVEKLLEIARRAASNGLDAKVRHLLLMLRELESSERDANVKVLVFTEFLPTQEMLVGALEGGGIETVTINGSMTLDERALAQQAFRDRARILVSTDAGGEGINLQFAHIVINWDLPWTPTKIEQRIGRVDRIGQTLPVKAYNLVRENSIDERVLGVLEAKLDTILAELGADKRGDVLESLSTRSERLYVDAIVDPDALERSANTAADAARDEVVSQAPLLDLLAQHYTPSVSADYDSQNSMRLACEARARLVGDDVGASESMDLFRRLPSFECGEPVPLLTDAALSGWWACFEVADGGYQRTCFSIFAPDGAVLIRPDVAERCWSRLASTGTGETAPPPDASTFDAVMNLGRDHGYRAWAKFASAGVPTLILRLMVRVTP